MLAAMNLPTLITLIIVVALLSLAIWRLYRQAKGPDSSCGCGGSCSSCPSNACGLEAAERKEPVHKD